MDRHGSPGLGPRHDASSRIQKAEAATDKLAALKARVAAALSRQPPAPAPPPSRQPAAPVPVPASQTQAKGGLTVGLHPLLSDVGSWKPPNKSKDSKQSRSASKNATPSLKKPLDLSGPSQEEIKSNPYYDSNLGASAKPRQARQLVFNQKGKFVAQANALRRQAALEALKKKIAETTRKAGIDDDDVEKNFLIQEPPEKEWWDEALLVDGAGYDSDSFKIDTPDSIITSYIQHPIPIDPPGDKHIPAPKPMFMTKKETKKIRRQRRMAEMKEEQAKQRLGLIAAPAPKVKKGNLMRVLGEEAVQDPTSVEARVNREIEERHKLHLEANEARKLSKEQKHEKLAENQEKDAAKGLHVVVFRINTLANGQFRYKININAEQLGLMGLCIMSPKQNLVIVEGGAWGIAKFRKLMLERIDWTENAPSRNKDEKSEALRQWLMAENEEGVLKDMSTNKCTLVFDGEIKAYSFRKWSSRVCETDSEARDVLSRSKMESFWTLAKSMA